MRKRVLRAALALMMVVGVLAGIPFRVNAITRMSASENCVNFIKNIEGFHAIPYWDYAQWTVGFGTACPAEDLQRYQQEGIPVGEAEELLRDMMVYFNQEVNKFMVRHNIQLTQQQFDAIFSLTYNLGPNWLYKTDQKLVQAIIKGTGGNELVYLMGLRSNAGGQFQPGLLKRRLMEADLYLNGRYNTKMPADYAIVYYDSGNGKCEAAAQGYDMHLPAQPLAVPTYEGYNFLGWYTKPDGGVRVTELNESTHGITLYAHWEKKGITDNLSGTPIDSTVVTVQAYMLNIRTGPGTIYSVAACVPKGTELTITATALRNGVTWGKCSQGWLSLAHTNYKPSTGTGEEEDDQTDSVQLPVGATVMNTVTVYNGPHTSYPKRGSLSQGQQIQVLQLQNFLGKLWARFAGGWIRVDQNLMLHDEQVLTHSFTATITNSYLNVRTGPGTGYSLAGSLAQGDQVQILAVEVVDGAIWGRCYSGWISLSYTDFDESMLPRYRSHTYGDWYDVESSSCTEQGQQRRDCKDCEHSEIRAAELKEHQFGDWYEVIAPTYTDQGRQARDCQACGYQETRETDCLQQPNIHIYGTVTGCDALNIRADAGAGNAWVGSLKRGDRVEILEQKMADGKVWGRCEKGWFCITGYVTVETVTEEPGQTPEEPAVKIYGTLTGYYKLNIRAEAGTQYALVGELAKGDRVEILEQVQVGEQTWGRIDRGWICLTGYMTLETVTDDGEEKQLMTVTAYSLNIRAGAGTGYAVVGTLLQGDRVEVLETKTVDGKTWARIAEGWVSMAYLE